MTRDRNQEPQQDPEFDEFVRRYAASDNLDERLALHAAIRTRSREWAQRFERWLIEQDLRLRGAVAQLQSILGELRGEIERLTAPPLHPATFLAPRVTSRGTYALVAERTGRRVVALAAGIDPATIGRGQDVLLAEHMNVVVDVTPTSAARVGETASFERCLGGARIVVRARDEELVVETATDLDAGALRAGEPLLFDRELRLAWERLPHDEGAGLFLEQTPTATFDDVGGLDEVVGKLKEIVALRFEEPELASLYGLRPPRAVLLCGPPGCGKTLLARAFANWVARVAPSGCSRFINVKPSAMSSMWYGQSEANYRRVFTAARKAAERDPGVPVVIFFDEIDAVGAARGATLARVDDRVLQALMVELDGLESRGNVLVLAATNRADALDPALVRAARLGDLILEVPRPGRAAAQAILARHIAPSVPIVPALGVEADARGELLDAAVAVIYRESDDNVLATLTFRDGRTRAVAPRDVVCGAGLEKIANEAVTRAWKRARTAATPGLTLEDLLAAADAEFARAARLLSPANCHGHLAGLPETDVVGVAHREPPRAPAWRYLRPE